MPFHDAELNVFFTSGGCKPSWLPFPSSLSNTQHSFDDIYRCFCLAKTVLIFRETFCLPDIFNYFPLYDLLGKISKCILMKYGLHAFSFASPLLLGFFNSTSLPVFHIFGKTVLFVIHLHNLSGFVFDYNLITPREILSGLVAFPALILSSASLISYFVNSEISSSPIVIFHYSMVDQLICWLLPYCSCNYFVFLLRYLITQLVPGFLYICLHSAIFVSLYPFFHSLLSSSVVFSSCQLSFGLFSTTLLF